MLSDLEYIRLILSLPRRVVLNEYLGTGDGTIKTFQCQLWPIISETVYIDGIAKTKDTDYTIDEDTGLVTFETSPADTEVITADYAWSVFSDVAISGLLDRYNDAIQPVLRDLVQALLANSDLFVKYVIGMESVDRSKALDALKALLEQVGSRPASAMAQAVIWTRNDIKAESRDVPWVDFITSTPSD